MNAKNIKAPVYFIRHGQTDWNIKQRFQGRSDIPLNNRGREQAVENAALLAPHPTSVGDLLFVSSPLVRASKTAQLILSELGRPADDFTVDPALIEISFGAFEGLTSAEAKQEFYAARQRRRKDRWSIAPPGGESFADRVDGVAKFLTGLPAHSVVISHSGIMRIIFHLLQNVAPLAATNLEIPHVGVTIWDGKRLISR